MINTTNLSVKADQAHIPRELDGSSDGLPLDVELAVRSCGDV